MFSQTHLEAERRELVAELSVRMQEKGEGLHLRMAKQGQDGEVLAMEERSNLTFAKVKVNIDVWGHYCLKFKS